MLIHGVRIHRFIYNYRRVKLVSFTFLLEGTLGLSVLCFIVLVGSVYLGFWGVLGVVLFRRLGVSIYEGF